MPQDIEQYSDDEVLSIADKLQAEDPSFLQGQAQQAEQFGVGVGEGVVDFAQRGSLFIREMLDKTGLTDKDFTKDIKSRLEFDREKQGKALAESTNPTARRFGQTAGTVLSTLPVGGGGITGGAIAGGTLGALFNEDDRLKGAGIGAALGGGLGAVAKGARKLLPQRVNEKAFQKAGVKPSRSQAIGAKPRTSPQEAQLAQKAQGIAPAEKINTFQDDFTNLLAERESKVRKLTDKLFDKTFKGKVGEQKFEFSAVKDSYQKVRESLVSNKDTTVQSLVRELDDLFAKPQDLRHVHKMVKSDGRLNDIVESLGRKSSEEVRVGRTIRNQLRDDIKTKLRDTDPKSFRNFIRANEVSKKKIVDIESKEITKAIRSGNFDSITSQLKGASGKKVYGNLIKALGPQSKPIIQSGVIRRSYEKAFDKVGKFDSARFLKDIRDVQRSSRMVFGKDQQRAIHNLDVVMKSIKENPPTALKVEGIVAGRVNKLMEHFLDGPVGMKVLTRAKFSSPKDIRARRFIDTVIKAGISTGFKLNADDSGGVDVDSMSDDEIMQLAKQFEE